MALKVVSYGVMVVLICAGLAWIAGGAGVLVGSKESLSQEVDYIRYAAPLMPLDNPSPIQAYGTTRRMLEPE